MSLKLLVAAGLLAAVTLSQPTLSRATSLIPSADATTSHSLIPLCHKHKHKHKKHPPTTTAPTS